MEDFKMRINTNIMAIDTYRNYSINNNNVSNAVSKLSSGYAINSASDDAAGLAISEKMRAQIRGLDTASKNSEDAVSLMQTAEGALDESQSILQRMRELSVQSSSDTNDDTVDRAALDEEFGQLKNELDDISSKTQFNGTNLLDGTYTGKIVQTGSNQGDTLSITLDSSSSSALGVDSSTVATQSDASDAITAVNTAINTLSTQRSYIGALENRLNDKISNLNTSSENLSAAESRIRDVDMASEMTTYTQNNILVQASTAMLAQANSQPQAVLKLLQ
jgi:flagellin